MHVEISAYKFLVVVIIIILQIYLGQLNKERFAEPHVQRIFEEFSDHLKDISLEIHERNKQLDIPYFYLLPECVPNSITI